MSKFDLIISKPERRSIDQLRRLQALPLEQKINLTKRRIDQFVREMNGKIYVSFSGGKDSLVLLYIVRSIFPEAIGVFCDTGLELPEIREFIKTIPNIEWIKPDMPFTEVIRKYGYPLPSKDIAQKVSEARTTNSKKLYEKRMGKGSYAISDRWKFLVDAPFDVTSNCCNVMKKNPFKKYEKKTGLNPIMGVMASESNQRTLSWIRTGCNAFDTKRPNSKPMSFWDDSDVWEYIKTRGLKYSKAYDMGYYRTGCTFCLFGYWHKDVRPKHGFTMLEKTHPHLHKYCMDNLGMREVIRYVDAKLNNGQLDLFDS